MKKERIDENDELERYCPRCDEWWPADKEFFYSSGPRLNSYCKVCYQQWRISRRQLKPKTKQRSKGER